MHNYLTLINFMVLHLKVFPSKDWTCCIRQASTPAASATFRAWRFIPRHTFWRFRYVAGSYFCWGAEIFWELLFNYFGNYFSPPVRWGLLDFMSVSSPPPSPSPSPPPRLPSPCPVAILCVQCGMSDLNCDPVSSVWRAGPQLRSCECSVAYRTPTAILRVQCGVPDPNRDPANSVWRPGPQPRSCEFSVASRTPTAILWVQCGVPDLKYCVRKFVRKNDRRYVRKNDRRYVRRNVKRICQKICQKECQKICQKDVRKNVRRYVRKNVRKICQKEW